MRSDIFILLLVLLCACRAHPHTRIGALSARGKDSDLRRHSLARTCPEPVLGRPLRLAGGSGGVESDPRSMIEEGERLFAVATGRRQGEQEGQSSCLKALVRLLMGGNPLDMSAAKKTALLEQAADMFESASVKSKLQADLKQAGFSLMRAAECYKNIRDRSFEAADKFFEAGNILKQDSVQDALESFRRAADLYMTDKNAINLQAAARIFREMGTLYEQEGDSESSISSYQRAVDLFKADGMPSLADGCLVKMANLAAASRKFPTAISSYRQLIKAADVSEGKSAGGCSGEDLRFRSLLCYLAQGALDEFQSAFQDYVEADLSFRDSAFAHIAEKLREAVVSKSMDVFNKQVRDLSGSATFDRSVSSLFTLIKLTLSRQGEEGKRLEQQLATQDDEDIL
mmetsp:Transcript_34341/g.77360  ORF Transcript_34341/g.77360 Transcript_34341/m.77360 type:complete len:400 (-) Transcript_34341:10-1209(-)